MASHTESNQKSIKHYSVRTNTRQFCRGARFLLTADHQWLTEKEESSSLRKWRWVDRKWSVFPVVVSAPPSASRVMPLTKSNVYTSWLSHCGNNKRNEWWECDTVLSSILSSPQYYVHFGKIILLLKLIKKNQTKTCSHVELMCVHFVSNEQCFLVLTLRLVCFVLSAEWIEII